MKKPLVKPFILFLVALVVVGCFLVFGPFLIEIIIAAVLVSSLYRPYSFFVRLFRGRRALASILMCLLAVAFIIFPLTELTISLGKRSVDLYDSTVQFVNNYDSAIKSSFISKITGLGFDNSSVKNFVFDVVSRSSSWMVGVAASIIKGTTGFFFSLILIVFTMFFFFVDGERMLKKLMIWSPLPERI